MELYEGVLWLMLASLIAWAWRKSRGRSVEMVEEFIEDFPGVCLICSYHRFGYHHGYEDHPDPPQHDCIEKKSEGA